MLRINKKLGNDEATQEKTASIPNIRKDLTSLRLFVNELKQKVDEALGKKNMSGSVTEEWIPSKYIYFTAENGRKRFSKKIDQTQIELLWNLTISISKQLGEEQISRDVLFDIIGEISDIIDETAKSLDIAVQKLPERRSTAPARTNEGSQPPPRSDEDAQPQSAVQPEGDLPQSSSRCRSDKSTAHPPRLHRNYLFSEQKTSEQKTAIAIHDTSALPDSSSSTFASAR